MKRVQAILFDNDGVLVESERPLREKIHEWLLECENYDLSVPELIEALRGKNAYQIEDILTKAGVSLPDGFSSKIFNYVKKYKPEYSKKMPDVEEMLQALDDYPKVVCSNALAEYYPIDLESKGLAEYFKGFFGIDNTGFAKPHPGIYLAGAKHLNIDIANCLILEDSPGSGLAAAVASGAGTIVGLTGSGALKEDFIDAGAHYVIDSLLELPKLIEDINS